MITPTIVVIASIRYCRGASADSARRSHASSRSSGSGMLMAAPPRQLLPTKQSSCGQAEHQRVAGHDGQVERVRPASPGRVLQGLDSGAERGEVTDVAQ